MRVKMLITAFAAAMFVGGVDFTPLQAADEVKTVSFNIKGAT